jgi:hypothetical protein
LLDEYRNDPRIDQTEPEYLREIHAIRLRLQDEQRGLSCEQVTKTMRENTIDIFARNNLPLRWAALKPISPLHPTSSRVPDFCEEVQLAEAAV